MKIHSIASYIPSQYIDNVAQAEKFGESKDFLNAKIGAFRLPRKEISELVSDMATNAVQRLLAKTECNVATIDALVLVTQNGDGYNLPHTSARVHANLGLPKTTAVFDVSLGCSGFVYGLQILKGLMQANGYHKAILVTADPYSKIIDPADRSTTLLFGDAASATLISNEGAWEISKARLGSDGAGRDHIMVKDGQLSMNGRQVFNFAATRIPEEIRLILVQESLEEQDIDSYCLHQGSAGIIKAISRRFPGVAERFVCRMADIGNTVSSSIPLLLEDEMLKPSNNRILLSGFGVGLSWGTLILTKNREK